MLPEGVIILDNIKMKVKLLNRAVIQILNKDKKDCCLSVDENDVKLCHGCNKSKFNKLTQLLCDI